MPALDSLSFRHLMGCFPTGIVIATVEDAKLGAVGLTINSLTSVSLAPPMVLFCLDKKAHLHAAFRRTKHFAINFLAADQQDISQHFANYRRYPEPKRIWDKDQEGCPILRETLGWAACKTVKIVNGGDHSIFLGEVIALKQRKATKTKAEKAPLVYFKGRYRNLKD